MVLVALLPVAGLGLWVLGTAERSAEEVLRSRLEQSLTELTGTVGSGWVRYRSILLDLAEAETVRGALRGTGTVAEEGESADPAVGAAWEHLEAMANRSARRVFGHMRVDPERPEAGGSAAPLRPLRARLKPQTRGS